MSYAFDPAYLPALEPYLPLLLSRPVPKVGEWQVIRSNVDTLFSSLGSTFPSPAGITQDTYTFTSYDGASIELLHTHLTTPQPPNTPPGPAILHAHGGGMIAGSASVFSAGIAANCFDTEGIQIFSVNYRKAPEHPFPTPPEDVYAGLLWVHSQATKFNIDPSRIAIMGESAGGGLAAGVALMARDRGLAPPLAKQILIYPMLDDRNIVPNAALEKFASWNNVMNVTGWTAYVGANKVGDADPNAVSLYAAPARAVDQKGKEALRGLPRTYMDIGELDLFKVEDLEYAAGLARGDVPLEFHLYPGVPHAFEGLARETEVAKLARRMRLRAMMDF